MQNIRSTHASGGKGRSAKRFSGGRPYPLGVSVVRFCGCSFVTLFCLFCVACAWHRQVRLASLAAAKHTPQKSKQRNDRKTKPKARRRGAVPAEPLWGSAAAFSAAHGFLSLVFCRLLHLLNLPFRSGYGSIAPRASQRPQNRRLKHPYKDSESRVRKVPCSAPFLSMRHSARP